MAGAQIPTSVTILNSLKGFQAISLNEYSTSAAASIAAGSIVEIAGAFFQFASDDTPDASTWTSIATGSTAYIALTPSGTAGSQIVSVTYTATAPTWRDDFQGWYASAASTTRVIGTVYKIDTPSYYPKFLYGAMQDGKQRTISANSASVASTLSTQNASVSSNLSVAGLSYTSGVVPVNNVNATTTTGIVYSAISPYLPSIGDRILVSGAIYIGPSFYISSLATRSSASTITFYSINTSGVISPIQVTSGGVTSYGFELAW